DFAATVRARRLLVEACPRLVAESFVLDELRYDSRHRHERIQRVEVLGIRLTAQAILKVLHDVSDNVDADEITQTEAPGLGASEQRAIEEVHLLDREPELFRSGEGQEHLGDPDAIADEVGSIPTGHDPLPECSLTEVGSFSNDFCIGRRAWNHFEEVHPARRIEK